MSSQLHTSAASYLRRKLPVRWAVVLSALPVRSVSPWLPVVQHMTPSLHWTIQTPVFGQWDTRCCSWFKNRVTSRRQWVRFPMASSRHFIDLILPAGVDSASNRNEYLLGHKGNQCARLTTLPPSRVESVNILGASTPWIPNGLSTWC